MSNDEQKLRVRLVGRDGRRRYDPGSKERLVAACLQPGVSVSGLALAHGINANLLRKWVKDAREAGSLAGSARSAFIPVVAADCSLPIGNCSLDMPVTCGEDHAAIPEKTAQLSRSSKMSALLPNGVKLTLECGDLDALTAIIGALGHVQTGGADIKVYLHREPIDFRAGINSLAVLVQEVMELDPFAPAVFAFCNRRRDRMKLLFFDRSGFVMVLKRLTEDRFRWPRRETAVVTLSTEQLHWILDGIDIDAMVRHPVRQYQIAG